jgi:hydantoinase/carbamoylase family amidase
MTIDEKRIFRDIETIAGFNDTAAEIGYSRPTFSAAWVAARDYIIAEVQGAGCKVRFDAAGNLHARHASIPWDAKVWLSGSHIDSVPTGGKFDGVIGIVCPLEILRSAHDASQVVPLELIIFAEEEGTTFGLGMIGSRLWTNPGEAQHVDQFKNRQGQTYFEAGTKQGVVRAKLIDDHFDPSRYHGFIEIHIEQGPAMWAEGIPLAVVTAIAGRKQFNAKFIGTPNHAGSTPMRYRADPLLAAAKIISAVDATAREAGPPTVATVGQIECLPNAVNVIPGMVRFTVDLRSPDVSILANCHQKLEDAVTRSASTGFNFFVTEDQPPVSMDAGLINQLNKNTGSLTISGALHDAAILAPLLPTAMLFVASKDGISHNPAEFSRMEDIADAARVLKKLVAKS